MRPFHAPNGTGETLARYSFLEPIVHGRRVLEIGAVAATGGASAEALARRGAASVVAVDDEQAIAAARQRAVAGVEWRSVRLAELPAGKFELVVFHDGALLAATPERVVELARLLSPRGHLVSTLPVPGAPGLAALAGLDRDRDAPAYESFVGTLAAVFPVVEIATQSPAVGWVLAAAADAEPDLAVDGTYGAAQDATAYLAVCGAAPSGLSGMCLVTLPIAPLLADRAAAAAEAAEHAIPADDVVRGELAAARADAASAGADAEEAERRAAEAALDLARSRAEVADAEERAAAAAAERDRLRGRVAELEAQLAAARAAEVDRARERDEARREAAARAREARSWADAQARLEQRLVECETLARSHSAEVDIAHQEAARALAEASEARARAEAARFEADALRARAEGAEAELRRLSEDLRAARRSQG